MISTIFKLSWLNLRRDRVALMLTFALPVIFFSIFASVFGAMDDATARPVSTALVLVDEHPVSTQLADFLREEPGLEIVELEPSTRQAALEEVQKGQLTLAAVFPVGFGEALAGGEATRTEVELLSDASNPIAVALVSGLLQTAALRLGVEALAGPGIPGVEASTVDSAVGGLRLRVVDVLGGEGKRPSVAFFTAGLGVMFLLFAVSGRSAILIEERENGVLKRMLAARASMTHLLLGRWLFLVVLGAAQVTVMFVWAALVFGLELWVPRHLMGFAVMTLASAATAAAFGLVLSTACRSRAQLNGVSTVVILILSALGGNMFPSFLMPEHLQAIGRLTFNAWALDGYQQVFWYEGAVADLGLHLAILTGFCVVFLAVARVLAARWHY